MKIKLWDKMNHKKLSLISILFKLQVSQLTMLKAFRKVLTCGCNGKDQDLAVTIDTEVPDPDLIKVEIAKVLPQLKELHEENKEDRHDPTSPTRAEVQHSMKVQDASGINLNDVNDIKDKPFVDPENDISSHRTKSITNETNNDLNNLCTVKEETFFQNFEAYKHTPEDKATLINDVSINNSDDIKQYKVVTEIIQVERMEPIVQADLENINEDTFIDKSTTSRNISIKQSDTSENDLTNIQSNIEIIVEESMVETTQADFSEQTSKNRSSSNNNVSENENNIPANECVLENNCDKSPDDKPNASSVITEKQNNINENIKNSSAALSDEEVIHHEPFVENTQENGCEDKFKDKSTAKNDVFKDQSDIHETYKESIPTQHTEKIINMESLAGNCQENDFAGEDTPKDKLTASTKCTEEDTKEEFTRTIQEHDCDHISNVILTVNNEVFQSQSYSHDNDRDEITTRWIEDMTYKKPLVQSTHRSYHKEIDDNSNKNMINATSFVDKLNIASSLKILQDTGDVTVKWF